MKLYNLAFLTFFLFPSAPPINESQLKLDNKKSHAVNIVFKSADGGLTREDISEGLPGDMQGDDIRGDGFISNDNGLYLRAGNGIYHSNSNSIAPFWRKETFPDKQASISAGKPGVFAYSYADLFLQQTNPTCLWPIVNTNLKETKVRTVIETAAGTVVIGSNKGLFKSTDSGKSWKQVQGGPWEMKLLESNGVLLATGPRGIIRSVDDGAHWDRVISEGGVGIALEHIKGGFAAITYSSASRARRVRTSYDCGKTWQLIDAGLTPQLSTASIIESGDSFFCGHPAGIFKSSDKGKTWTLLLPSIDNKVFNLFVSGNVIYAIPRIGGC